MTERDRIHRDKRLKKVEKIAGLKDLLEAWEPLEASNYEYVQGVRRKLRMA